ncbi:hypothetical protein BSKO_01763 [Bryopsis sp. KO-2023]|nr:hypothetical protein BSKO_01763 [Bryopsis sp. KO-2023]
MNRIRRDLIQNWAGLALIPSHCFPCISTASTLTQPCAISTTTTAASPSFDNTERFDRRVGQVPAHIRWFACAPLPAAPEGQTPNPSMDASAAPAQEIADDLSDDLSDVGTSQAPMLSDLEQMASSYATAGEVDERASESDFIREGGSVQGADGSDSESESGKDKEGKGGDGGDELFRIEAAKDADDMEDGMVRRPPRMEERPGYIDFTKFNTWADVQVAVDKAGDDISPAQIVAAFTRLKQIIPRANTKFLARLSEMVMQSVETLKSWHIVAIFHACAKLRYKNIDLLNTLAEEMLRMRNTKALYSMEIANLVYSMGILSRFEVLVQAAERGLRVPDVYHLYSVQPPPTLFDLQDDLMEAVCNELAVPHRLTDFREQELANTIYGLGLLRYRNTAALKALGREVTSLIHLPKFTPQEISNIVYGFGLLGFQEDNIYETISTMVLKHDKMETFTTQNIANMLYGFARVNFSSPSIMAALRKEIETSCKSGEFREQEISNIVSCLALLDAGTPSVYDALLKEAMNPARMPRFVDHNLSTMILGLAQAQHRNEAALDALVEELMKPERMANLTSKDIGDIIVGLNGLDYVHNGFMQVLSAELRKPARVNGGGQLWETCRANLFSWSLVTPFI